MHLIKNSKARLLGIIFPIIVGALLLVDGIISSIYGTNASVFGYFSYVASILLIGAGLLFYFAKNEQFGITLASSIIMLVMIGAFVYLTVYYGILAFSILNPIAITSFAFALLVSISYLVMLVFIFLFGIEVFNNIATIVLTLSITTMVAYVFIILFGYLNFVSGTSWTYILRFIVLVLFPLAIVPVVRAIQDAEGEDRHLF